VSFAAQQALRRGLYFMFRLAFNSNDAQAGETGGGEPRDSSTGNETDPVVRVIESTQRMSAGMTVNWYPVIDTRYRIGFNAEAEFSARRQEPFVLPMATVGGATLPLDSLYGAERLEQVRSELDAWRPNGSFLAGANLEFPDLGGHPTYALAQVGVTAVTGRRIEYQAVRSADPSSLKSIIDTRWPGLLRVGPPMWVADFVDVRADVVVPARSKSALEPLMRVILSKPFS
jgi:hypothetical protein